MVGFDKVTTTVSSISSTASSTMSMAIFWLVTPGAKVSVPLANV